MCVLQQPGDKRGQRDIGGFRLCPKRATTTATQQQVSLLLTNVGAGRAEQQEERSEAVNRAKDFFLFAACTQLQSVPLRQQQALLRGLCFVQVMVAVRVGGCCPVVPAHTMKISLLIQTYPCCTWLSSLDK